MTIAELAERMKEWPRDAYRVVIFSDTEPVAYALFKEGDDVPHLRHFFVRRDRRR